MNRRLLILSAFFALNCSAADHTRPVLEHTARGFAVIENGKRQEIPAYLVDKDLRGRTPEQIAKLAKSHSLRLNKATDGSYEVRAHLQTKGGGPITGCICYWVTKTACYAVGLAGVGTAVASIGGPIAGVAAAAAGSGASPVVGLAAAGIANGAAAPAAVAATQTMIGAMGVAQAVAVVESAACTAGSIGAAIPFLP